MAMLLMLCLVLVACSAGNHCHSDDNYCGESDLTAPFNAICGTCFSCSEASHGEAHIEAGFCQRDAPCPLDITGGFKIVKTEKPLHEFKSYLSTSNFIADTASFRLLGVPLESYDSLTLGEIVADVSDCLICTDRVYDHGWASIDCEQIKCPDKLAGGFRALPAGLETSNERLVEYCYLTRDEGILNFLCRIYITGLN
ncbi:uncharacterized protein LOC100368176 [Saccoglossus kowalevskii]